jgi:serine/threonine-protein kinase RsbW
MSENTGDVCEFNSEKLVLALDLQVEADVAKISRVVDRIMNEVSRYECAAGKEFEVRTALQEAVANAVVHGCKGDPTHRVRVCVACDSGKGILIIVRDPGAGFDPDGVPSPLHAERLFESHGRGIYLINELMDEVRFRKGGTEIWMRKR